jgi:hypothetical protein
MRNVNDIPMLELIETVKQWKLNGFSFEDFYSYYSMGVSLKSAIEIRELNKDNPLLSLFNQFNENNQ